MFVKELFFDPRSNKTMALSMVLRDCMDLTNHPRLLRCSSRESRLASHFS